MMACIASNAQSHLSDGLPGRFDQNRRNTPRPTSTQPIYRSIDGTNNNIARTKAEWGATNIALAREIPAESGAFSYKFCFPNHPFTSANMISLFFNNPSIYEIIP